MFGYVTANEPELKVKDYHKYKAYYCGLCQSLKRQYGSAGQLTLAYDMTFVIILLTSLYESETKAESHRCKMHPLKPQPMLENEITEYAADMNLIMAYYHLEDDWKDEKKVAGLLGSMALKRKVEKAIWKYPRQSRVIREEMAKLSEYESQGIQEVDYPAGCFGRLMEEMMVGILRIEEVDLEAQNLILTVAEALDCSGLPELDYEVCTYDEGLIAGILECFTGKPYEVKEVDCWCTGDRTCRFRARRVAESTSE